RKNNCPALHVDLPVVGRVSWRSSVGTIGCLSLRWQRSAVRPGAGTAGIDRSSSRPSGIAFSSGLGPRLQACLAPSRFGVVVVTALLLVGLLSVCAFAVRATRRRRELQVELDELRASARVEGVTKLRNRQAFIEDLEI